MSIISLIADGGYSRAGVTFWIPAAAMSPSSRECCVARDHVIDVESVAHVDSVVVERATALRRDSFLHVIELVDWVGQAVKAVHCHYELPLVFQVRLSCLPCPPASARASARVRPSPRPPPVTMKTRPSSWNSGKQ